MTRTTLAVPPDPRDVFRRIAGAARQAGHPLRHWWATPARVNRAVRGLADTAPATRSDIDQLADNIHPGGHVESVPDLLNLAARIAASGKDFATLTDRTGTRWTLTITAPADPGQDPEVWMESPQGDLWNARDTTDDMIRDRAPWTVTSSLPAPTDTDAAGAFFDREIRGRLAGKATDDTITRFRAQFIQDCVNNPDTMRTIRDMGRESGE